MALTPQEQAELDALELQDLESQAAAYEASRAELSNSQVDRDRIGAVPPPAPREPMTAIEQAADTAKSVAIKGGFTGVGQALGASTGLAAPVAVPLFGGIFGGAGYLVDQARKGEDVRGGELLTEMAGSAIGGPATAIGKGVVREAAFQGLTNVGLKAVQVGMDEGRSINLKEGASAFALGAGADIGARSVGKGANAFLDGGRPKADDNAWWGGVTGTLAKLRKEGIMIAPHTVERGSDTMSSIGGKAALEQTMAKRNNRIYNRMAREDIGLRGELPIYDETLESVRNNAAAPYEEIQRISEEAKVQLEKLRKDINDSAAGDSIQEKVLEAQARGTMDPLVVQAGANVEFLKGYRKEAKAAWDEVRANTPGAYDKWQAAVAKADAMEAQIEKAGELTGNKKLVEQLRESRRIIAKTHAIQEAINPVSGWLDPVIIGRMRQARIPLDGKLKLIGDAQLVFSKESRLANKVPAPGVDNIKTQFALTGLAHGSAAGTAASIGQTFVGAAPRWLYQRQWLQDELAKPRSGARALPKFLEGAVQAGGMSAGRNNPFLYRGEDPRRR